MADTFYDRVQETTSTTGTGAIVLGGASPSFRAFSSVYANGGTVRYCYVDPVAGAWEVAQGVYSSSGNSISRVTLEASSTGAFLTFAGNAGAYVFGNFSAAQLQALTAPWSRTIYTASGSITVANRTVAIINATSQCDMTLADPAVDGLEMEVKRWGAGIVTLTLKLDGAAGATLTANGGGAKEIFKVRAIVGDATLGTTWMAD